MNEIAPQHRQCRTTQAAEGHPRWRWTTAELLRLTELGAFTSEDRFELIGGEIVPMSPKGRRHEVIADQLQHYWTDRAVPELRIGSERQFNLDEDSYTLPDLIVRPAGIQSYDLRGDTILLVVEVADTSLYFDRTAKAALYARHGVREYWVINARTLVTTVHRSPGSTGYADILDVGPAETMIPLLAPALAVRLTDVASD